MRYLAKLLLVAVLSCPALVLAGPVGGGTARPEAQDAIAVRVDPRVELVTVVARLAGLAEYRLPGIPAYDRAVDAHFTHQAAHPAVMMLKRLQVERGIGYNAVVEAALSASPQDWTPAVALTPWPDGLDRRWDATSLRAFQAAMGDFARDSDAEAFFAAQQPLYAQVEAAVRGNLQGRLEAGWYRTQVPARAVAAFTVIPALLAGNNSYGPHLRLADGREQVFGVLATPALADGAAIEYPADPQLALLVHEFHHSFLNPWVDAHADVLLPAAQPLYEASAARMQALAYGDPRIMLYESLVRANTLRYLRRHGEDAVLRRLLAEDRGKGFAWTPALADLLDAEGAQPAFDDATATRVARLIADWGRDGGARVAAEEARLEAERKARQAQGPQILALLPAQDAEVAPGATELEVHFDRPMAPGLSIFGDVPQISGKPRWNDSATILYLPVTLAPGGRYRLYLNSEEAQRIRSVAGEPLAPREWRFSARGVPAATD